MVDNKYQRGKIYKLVSKQTDKVYVGSTTLPKLIDRFKQHQSAYKSYIKGNETYTTSYELVKYDDCEIILLEIYSCNSKKELTLKEQDWIEQTPNTTNKKNAICKIKHKRLNVDYKNGKIYKIVSSQTNKCYVGSTAHKLLNSRLSGHKSSYKSYLNNTNHYFTSFEIIKYDDCQIVLIENYPCNTEEELQRREGHWIKQLDCVNKFVTRRTRTEYFEDNHEKIKARDRKRHSANKEQRNLNKKIYRKNNPEKVKQQDKNKYQNNKDIMLDKAKQYYEKNKDKIKQRLAEKITCECGSVVTKASITPHKQSAKHISLMNEKNKI